MYYVKFTIKDFKTKEVREKKSKPLSYELANDIICRYLTNTSGVINIKCLGCGNWLVAKNGGEIKIEILKG